MRRKRSLLILYLKKQQSTHINTYSAQQLKAQLTPTFDGIDVDHMSDLLPNNLGPSFDAQLLCIDK
jgi:hypothetical protein